MKRLCLKNGLLLDRFNGYDFKKMDILVEQGRIIQIEEEIEEANDCLDCSGLIVSAGWIDVHTHVYPKAVNLGVAPDQLGLQRGATTVIDAGSSGPVNFDDFYQNWIVPAKTRVYALLNGSKEGLVVCPELDDPKKIDEKLIAATIHRYPETIVGIKARASATTVGRAGIVPIERIKKIAAAHQLPLMVHIGNTPPSIQEVLNLLQEKDIVTHIFHGKQGGLMEQGQIIEEAWMAWSRKVLFDVGHGEASFSIDTFQEARKQGFFMDLIGSDLHLRNYETTVKSLGHVLNKLLACQVPLPELIEKVTRTPARHFQLKDLGELKLGAWADFTIFKLEDCDEMLEDTVSGKVRSTQKMVVKYAISGKNGTSHIEKVRLNEESKHERL